MDGVFCILREKENDQSKTESTYESTLPISAITSRMIYGLIEKLGNRSECLLLVCEMSIKLLANKKKQRKVLKKKALFLYSLHETNNMKTYDI